MRPTWWTRSARDVDTLSWLTSSIVTASVAIVVVTGGLFAIVLGSQSGDRPAVQFVAVLIMGVAAGLLHRGARPARAGLSRRGAVGVYALVCTAVLVSSAGYTGAPALVPAVDAVADELLPGVPLQLELWWAPICAALVIMASSPFVPGRVLVPGASAVALTTGMASTLIALAAGSPYPGADSLIATSTVVFALLGGSVLPRTLIEAVDGWREVPLGSAREHDGEEAVITVVDRITGGDFTARVIPFLESVEAAEKISPHDRAQARELAADVRAALVAGVDRSWLSTHTAGRPVLVADPFRLADTITLDQRAAIIALIDGLFSDPEAGVYGARLDLAPGPDDAVAVAVTVELALPEGRRTSVLAPYYLSVESVVRRIEWRGGETFVVAFDVDRESG